MTATTQIKRFSVIDRIFHLFLMLTFLVQTATGLSRLFITIGWGKKLNALFGGYETSLLIHKWVGALMVLVFVAHILYLFTRIDWKNPGASLFGPNSLIPNLQDVKHFWQRTLWLFGLGAPPPLGRWTYWEKFDYWAVFWGMPLLAITGFMLMYPIFTSRFMPGWMLNIAALLHRAEAILAVTYIFVVHFFIGHLRPSSFPMNEAMFSGSVSTEEAMEEKPSWIEHLRADGKLEGSHTSAPALWYRVFYYFFGYAALIAGVYLLINGIVYSRYIALH
jgi:formate dehydrogenase gamma subunit